MQYRTVWMSDLHLGTRGSDAAGVLDFLKHNEFETLYLVGDIIDIWRLRRERYWPQSHNDVIQKILRKSRKGTEVVVIPGNHDEFCLNFLGVYGNIVVKEQHVHTTADGTRLLVLHGHEFDSVTVHARWMAHLGDASYTLLLKLNRPMNLVRRLFGFGYWSLSAYVKQSVKKVVSSISRFEEAVAHYAELHHVDGIVCGHIHTPAVRRIHGVDYYNTGDWVESSPRWSSISTGAWNWCTGATKPPETQWRSMPLPRIWRTNPDCSPPRTRAALVNGGTGLCAMPSLDPILSALLVRS